VRDFTLVMAYYDNRQMLIEHVRHWSELPRELARKLHVVVVDDGSPNAPAIDALQTITLPTLASVQIWRMLVNVPWNQDACRNLGVKHAPTEWLLLTDMDHVVPPQTWERLMRGPLDKRTVYRFGRVSAPTLEAYKRHPNSWALTKRTYWDCGGYDERLAGNYGTDGDFLVRVQRRRNIVDLCEVLVRVPREVVPDASTTTLKRKEPGEKDNIRRLLAERAGDVHWHPLHFSFPHKRVL
jgi:glycosyltransferase involved in cell wall biosynthesis